MIRFINFILLFWFFLCLALNAETVRVFEFTEKEFGTLKVRKVMSAKGKTEYSLGSNENGQFLRAEAKGTASGLGQKVKIDLNKTPFINIKKSGLLSNKAVNYVFSSNNSVNESWRSPYTKSSIDYVLSTTKDNINEWVTVKANVKEHFKKLHDLDVEELTGVAIMTDTDQTKIKAISYYQNIYFSSE